MVLWLNAPPDVSIKVKRKLHDMRMADRIVGVRSTEQFVWHLLIPTSYTLYIKIFDIVENWDIDNKFIKPIFDSLIISNVIKDDNINKVFYCARGEKGENPHTEVYITDVNNSVNLFKNMLD